MEVALVYPEDADDRAGKAIVCSGIGLRSSATEGDTFRLAGAEPTCRIRIGKVLYQPEAAGDFHLWASPALPSRRG